MSAPRQLFLNDGAPFLRADGSWVRRGDVFTPSPQERRQFAYKLRPFAPPDPPPGTVVPDVAADAVGDARGDAAPGASLEVTDGAHE